MRWKGFLFDLDGTLVDSLEDLRLAVGHGLASIGRPPLDASTMRSYIGDGVRVLLARALLGKESVSEDASETQRRAAIRELLEEAKKRHPDEYARALEAFGEHYIVHLTDHTRPYTGTVQALEALGEQGAQLAVVTNKPEKYTMPILDRLALASHFEVVVGGDTTEGIKPDAAPVAFALERMGTPARSTCMVGDSSNDLLAGRAAGCTTVAVTYGFNSPESLRRYEPDRFVDDLRELADSPANR